ncbi:hypothetical protein BH10PSE19_BH10PSE19_22360 [soil metagenome]
MPKQYVYSFTKIDNGSRRPLVPIRLTNPKTGLSVNVMALLDTGADACLLPKYIADGTGHDLKNSDAICNKTVGAGGQPINTWGHTFDIELLYSQNNSYQSVWKSKKTIIECVEHNNIPPLLGVQNFLKDLKITFNYPTNKIIIELP